MYTTVVLRNKPCPTPVTSLAAKSMPRWDEAADRAAPRAKTSAPRDMARGRPSVSDKGPARKEESAPVRRIEEMRRPWREGERWWKVLANWGMAVRGPMQEVSRPKREAPREVRSVAGR